MQQQLEGESPFRHLSPHPQPPTPRYLPPQVRGKKQPLTVTKMPFVPSNYYRGP